MTYPDLAAFRAALSAPQEDDMPLTDADVEKVARRAAELVWQRPTVNAWGAQVGAEQVLVGAEGRIADVQDRVYRLPNASGAVDVDALADAVVKRLAARLGSG